MKNKLILGLCLSIGGNNRSLACTNLIVGKEPRLMVLLSFLIPLIHTECLASCITILPVCMKKEPCVISMIGIRANI